MKKETAQALAEMFPHKSAEGKYQDGFDLDQLLDSYELWLWTSQGYCAARMKQDELETLRFYRHRQALIETTLKEIAIREGWDIEQHNWRDLEKGNGERWIMARIRKPYEVDKTRELLGSGEGTSDLEALMLAMMEAKRGGK